MLGAFRRVFPQRMDVLFQKLARHWYIDLFLASCVAFYSSSLFFLTFLLVFLLHPPFLFSSVYPSLSSSCLLGWSWPPAPTPCWPMTFDFSLHPPTEEETLLAPGLQMHHPISKRHHQQVLQGRISIYGLMNVYKHCELNCTWRRC